MRAFGVTDAVMLLAMFAARSAVNRMSMSGINRDALLSKSLEQVYSVGKTDPTPRRLLGALGFVSYQQSGQPA